MPTPTSAYYNDTDPYVHSWLRNLADATLITDGIVDGRDIRKLIPADLAGRIRVHLFAGIAGWEYALQLARWPAELPVWTGSCPCQPFSVAGKRKGTADKRHLWPEFHRLVSKCRPPVVFGEQVAGKDGRKWLAGVRFDLESLGYRVACADLAAASVGAPHIRQRLYWVADATATGRPRGVQEPHEGRAGSEPRREPGGVGDPSCQRYEEQPNDRAWFGDSPWTGAVLIPCLDGKARRIPVEPELFPLAPRLPGHVGQLRAYGNSIVPQVAAEFISSYMEAVGIPPEPDPIPEWTM